MGYYCAYSACCGWCLGKIKQGHADIVESLTGNCSLFEIQKTVLLESMAILRKILNIDKH